MQSQMTLAVFQRGQKTALDMVRAEIPTNETAIDSDGSARPQTTRQINQSTLIGTKEKQTLLVSTMSNGCK